MLPSVDYLKSAGLVADPAAIGHPLTQIRIIDATNRLIRAPETLFDSAEFGLPAFGWNLPNVKLAESFRGGASWPAQPQHHRDHAGRHRNRCDRLDADAWRTAKRWSPTSSSAPMARSPASARAPASAPARTASPRRRWSAISASSGRSAAPLSSSTTRRPVHAGPGRRQPRQSGLDRRSRRAEIGAGGRQGKARRAVPREIAAPVRRHRAADAGAYVPAVDADRRYRRQGRRRAGRRSGPRLPAHRRAGAQSRPARRRRSRRLAGGDRSVLRPASAAPSATTTRSAAPATWPAPAPWSMRCSARCSPSSCRRRRCARAGCGRSSCCRRCEKRRSNVGMGVR